jgi:hypothetical protein
MMQPGMAQNLAHFAQAGAPPQMAPQGMPQGMPPGMPPGTPPPGMPPQQPPQMQPRQQQPPPQQPGGPALTAAEMAKLGRFGDSIIAHLTPGEIAVPPQLQSPKVLATLKQAAEKNHTNIQQFMAGNPAQSHNPQTGAPEFSFWSAVLPAVLGVAGGAVGSMVAPGVGTAIGAGLGSAAGTAATGGSLQQSALAGVGGAVGGYFGGAGIDAATGAAGAGGAAVSPELGSQIASAPAMNGGIIGSSSSEAAMGGASPAAAQAATTGATMTPMAATNVGHFASATPPDWYSRAGLLGLGKSAANIGMGAGVGAALAPPPTQSSPAPFGNNPHMGPVNPNYQQLLGNTGASPTPQFTGYNPVQSVSGQPYNFYPQR